MENNSDPFYDYGVQLPPPAEMQVDYGVYDATALPDLSADPEERQQQAASANVHALQLVRENATTLCVRQGTIGSIIPTIGGSELEADYTQNALSLPGTATREYWLDITVEDGAVTAVSIDTTEPGADSATQAKLLLGSVETDSGDIVAFNSNLSGSQSFASCGTTHFFGLV